MNINFEKLDGLVPAVVQDAVTGKVLMLGFMNQEALKKTIDEKKVTFFSRTKNRLWTKGESSGNTLELISLEVDCDNDSLLIKARPTGPICHTGSDTCFNETNDLGYAFILKLQEIIHSRKNKPTQGSYTSELFAKGLNSIAQKVGEEAVELVIASKDKDSKRVVEEAADLLFHYLVLLESYGVSFSSVLKELETRHSK